MRKIGYLEIQRGRGFGLGRSAQYIVAGDLVRLTDDLLEVATCLDPDRNTGPLIGIPRLFRKIMAATHTCMTLLDDVTITNIAGIHQAVWIV